MTDRELLELAAKAAGFPIVEWSEFEKAYWRPDEFNERCGDWWNPLTDDGDALRLAVKLKLHLGYTGGNQYFAGPSISDEGLFRESGETFGVQDPYAATRRAIVRAAAEIGRQVRLPQEATPA